MSAKNCYRPLNHIEALKLEKALHQDAASLSQVAVASFFEGVAGANRGRFTWAKVKLYYSVFYCVRALLMMKGLSIFYIGKSPHSLEAKPGSSVKKQSGNSHSVAFKQFNQLYKNDLTLSQQIDSLEPLDWIQKQRDTASYRTAPLSDPSPPKEFDAQNDKMRMHLKAYFTDKKYLHAFDADHAIIAYPALMLLRLNNEILSVQAGQKIPVTKHYVDILSSEHCYVAEISSELDAFDIAVAE